MVSRGRKLPFSDINTVFIIVEIKKKSSPGRMPTLRKLITLTFC